MARLCKMLLALDLTPESNSLAQRVSQMYGEELKQLHVVHVIKHGLYDLDTAADQESKVAQVQRIEDHTLMQVREMLGRHGIEVPRERIHLAFGEPAFEIKRLASELHADLVIVGSHSRGNEWLQLPGATTNCVIQGIASDVIAVKV